MKAIYKDNVLRPLKKLDLQEGEVVEINMISTSLAKKFQGTIKLPDQKIIEEIAECDDII
jgi:predicted DNA-binding antitoxin AbrB/MazE fold protein